MPLPKSWTTVTPLSKTIAMILFILFPFIGFSAGMRYQQKLDETKKYEEQLQQLSPTPYPTVTPSSSAAEPKMCTQDAMQCSSGVWVGRTGPNCEFVCPK
jgi:hypothetical protein